MELLISLHAFSDELIKLGFGAKEAASKGRLRVAQSRKGRRPMRVTTMLRKEKDGTLYKKAYKLQGHTEVQGIPVAIENRKGSVRSGKNSDGTEWKTKFKAPYGYIKGTKGADGEEIDAYVGPDKSSTKAYVVHQRKDTGKGYDEDKVMLGFKSEGQAKKTFLQHYDDKKFLGPITAMNVDKLRDRVSKKKEHKKLATVQASSEAGQDHLNQPVPGNQETALDKNRKPGDVPSRDGTDPGHVAYHKREYGVQNVTTLPSLHTEFSSETGPMPRL
jgi:hypothetical protein